MEGYSIDNAYMQFIVVVNSSNARGRWPEASRYIILHSGGSGDLGPTRARCRACNNLSLLRCNTSSMN